MKSQILLILIDFDSFLADFCYETTFKIIITMELEEILRNDKRRSLIFAALSNSAMKKHFIYTVMI